MHSVQIPTFCVIFAFLSLRRSTYTKYVATDRVPEISRKMGLSQVNSPWFKASWTRLFFTFCQLFGAHIWWFLKVEHATLLQRLFQFALNLFLHSTSKTRIETQVSGTWSVTNTKAPKMRTLSPRRLWSHIGLFVRIYRYSLSTSLSGCPHPKKNKRYLLCPHWVYLAQNKLFFFLWPLLLNS